jgi:hypothetical protein
MANCWLHACPASAFSSSGYACCQSCHSGAFGLCPVARKAGAYTRYSAFLAPAPNGAKGRHSGLALWLRCGHRSGKRALTLFACQANGRMATPTGKGRCAFPLAGGAPVHAPPSCQSTKVPKMLSSPSGSLAFPAASSSGALRPHLRLLAGGSPFMVFFSRPTRVPCNCPMGFAIEFTSNTGQLFRFGGPQSRARSFRIAAALHADKRWQIVWVVWEGRGKIPPRSSAVAWLKSHPKVVTAS